MFCCRITDMKLIVLTLSVGLSCFGKTITFESNNYKLDGKLSGKTDKLALYLHGSGVLDRYQTLPKETSFDGSRPQLFKTISKSLEVIGYSSLLYDKRGHRERENVKKSNEIKAATGYKELLMDAQAALDFGISKKYK
jgi:hypothetical protein